MMKVLILYFFLYSYQEPEQLSHHSQQRVSITCLRNYIDGNEVLISICIGTDIGKMRDMIIHKDRVISCRGTSAIYQ